MTEVEAFIRAFAPTVGIDPDVAVAVARSEGGLQNPFRRGEGPAPKSQAPGLGATENSFGPFQLYISGNNAGLGDRAVAAGVDPREDWKSGIQYALTEASNRGWGQWYGAANSGIDRWQGITKSQQPRQFTLQTSDYGTLDPLGTMVNRSEASINQPPQSISGIGSPGTYEGIKPFTASPGGPVEAAGGGAGSDTPYSAPAASTGTQVAAAGKPGNPLSKLVSGLGQAFGTGSDGGDGGTGVRPTPAAARVDAPEVAPFNPMQAEQQRQMLALTMQRLNSGRLF